MSRNVKDQAADIKRYSVNLAGSTEQERNRALEAVKEALWENRSIIFQENQTVMDLGIQHGLSDPILKRLRFDESKLRSVLDGIEDLIRMSDPLGKTLLKRELDTA